MLPYFPFWYGSPAMPTTFSDELSFLEMLNKFTECFKAIHNELSLLESRIATAENNILKKVDRSGDTMSGSIYLLAEVPTEFPTRAMWIRNSMMLKKTYGMILLIT